MLLTEKDINIFTIVKDKNNISPLRQWCIDSWHKCMPNANIMIFDDNDLNNPNWIYYDVIKNDKLWNYYKYHKQFSNLESFESVSPVSTDSIRIRLLRVIPNALYMDSDAYLNIRSNEFLDLCNKYGDVNIAYLTKNFFSFTGYFAGAKNKFLNDIIEYYDKISIKNIYSDFGTINAFLEKYPKKEYSDIGFKNGFIKHIGGSRIRLYDVYNNDMYKTINIFIFDKDKDIELTRNNKCHNRDLQSFINQYIDFAKKIRYSKYIDENSILVIVINQSIFYIDDKYVYDIDGNVKLVLTNLHFTNGFTKEFIAKLKETINVYFKQVIDAGKTINFYELEDLGDNPCLLKKI